jgi:imidazolonepropionase-like amidohydrolase
MNPPAIVRWSLLAIVGLVLSNTGAAADSRPEQPIAFVHVNVVPMDKDQVLRDQTVIVNGGRIQGVGPAASTALPKDARVIRAAGQFLLPGLTDMHVHLYFPEELALYVANGVTTVFNLNGRPAGPPVLA